MTTKERSAELKAQADADITRALARYDVTLSGDARLVAELMWDAGYLAGMEWFKSITDEAFSRMRADV